MRAEGAPFRAQFYRKNWLNFSLAPLASLLTAALDAASAFQVSSAILGLDCMTRIVVTHSLDAALLRRYDSILVLKGGRIEEAGTFDELMSRRGYFHSLFTVSQ